MYRYRYITLLIGVSGWLLLISAMLILGPIIGAIRIGADFLAAEGMYPALLSLPK